MRRTAILCLFGVLSCDGARAMDPREAKRSSAPEHPLKSPLESNPSKPFESEPKAPFAKPADSGNSEPAVVKPAVYAKTRHVWIRSGPNSETQWLGMLWFGGSVPVRDGASVPGQGCGGRWIPVEPRGYVCVDGKRATLDPKDPTFLAISPFAPRVDSPTPHHYAWVSRDIRRFETLAHAEPFVRAWAGRKAQTFGHPAPLLPTLPEGLSERRDSTAARSALTLVGDGDYLDTGLFLTGDLSWVARADVEPLPEVTFQGVELGSTRKLPLGFTKQDDTPVYQRAPDGTFLPTSQRYPRFTPLSLDQAPVALGKSEYFRILETDHWVLRGETTIVLSREAYPREFAEMHAPADVPSSARQTPRNTWIEVSILGGFLIAYEGTRAVYATLTSAGRGGLPVRGRDLVSTASTPVGRFRITGKFKTATMESSSGPIVHSDVPWTQNFSGPHAIHGAYWHNDWGSLKSAGCVNVSPRDGKWLFEFSEPEVPPGWHGVRHHGRYGEATLIVLHD